MTWKNFLSKIWVFCPRYYDLRRFFSIILNLLFSQLTNLKLSERMRFLDSKINRNAFFNYSFMSFGEDMKCEIGKLWINWILTHSYMCHEKKFYNCLVLKECSSIISSVEMRWGDMKLILCFASHEKIVDPQTDIFRLFLFTRQVIHLVFVDECNGKWHNMIPCLSS